MKLKEFVGVFPVEKWKDVEQNDISHSLSNTLHYSSENYPYVGEFHYFWIK